MADGNQAAAASLPPVSKEKVSPPLPVVRVPAPVDDKVDVKQMTVLVQVDVKPAPVAVPILLMVCLWTLINAVVFAVANVATLIINRTPCNKSTWLFRCVTLTNAAAGEMSLLLYGELLCSALAVLAAPAPLHMLLTATTSRGRSGWRGAVDALAWVALAATVITHCMEVASDRIVLAAKPGDTYIFVDVVVSSVFVAVDLLASFLLCCSPRRLELQGHDYEGEV